MGYPDSGATLKYFQPIAGLAAGAITVLEQLDIGAASGDHGEMLCAKNCSVRAFWFTPIAEAVSGTTTAPTVVFTKRPKPGSATGESVIATLTVPSGTAIGDPVYVEVDPNASQFEVGDALEIAWTVGVGTPTGIGTWSLEGFDSPETVRQITGATGTTLAS